MIEIQVYREKTPIYQEFTIKNGANDVRQTRWDMLSVTKLAMSKASMGGANLAPDLSAQVCLEH